MQYPKHIALIMDGNRRWAQKKHFPKLEGHRQGEKAIEPLIDRSIKLKIPYLTFWAFSTENWNRSETEVKFLLNLFRHNLDKTVDNFHRKKVKLNIIGNMEKFPKDIIDKTKYWMDKTKENKAITVNIALGYGGRDEILRAIKACLLQSISTDRMTKELFSGFLDTAGQPDPDLLIRTGGEKRLSGFLLWQLEYAELYFTDVLWPDFTPSEFDKAIEFYSDSERRFGK